MAVNRVEIDAPCDAVWEVLVDAASYAIWVVGSKKIRGVDATWPASGSKFHHTVGWGPFQDRDTTSVLESEPPVRLVLEARVWPFGTAKVTMALRRLEGRTEVTMIEEPLRGAAKRLESRPMHVALKVRNTVALRRLKDWSEQRYHARPGISPMSR
jgi:uncharacterized protein YndB with AHSA1/START domain